MTKYNRPNGKLFGSSATNIGVFGSGQQNETPTNSTDPNTINTLGTHWEQGWDGAVVSQAPYTAPYINDMNAVNYVNSYNSAYLLQRGIAEYSSSEEYQQGSVCVYNNEIWMCKLDGTTNVTPTEGTYWHQQAELPVMSDNEVLVGSTGVGATVTDTLNQGDIIAATSGLDVKAGVITNTHISSQAGDKIDESKINLAYTTTALNTNIGNVSTNLSNHTSSTSNPHSTKISNLGDTNLSTLATDDTLVYDGVNSKWINQPNTVGNLKDTTISTPSNNDVLWYSSGSWVNTPNVNNHMTSKLNPHETSMDNLDDTNLSTPATDDTLVYDGVNSEWINQPNTLDNLKNITISSASSGDTLSYDGSKWVNSQPAGGALSTLTDTNITTPSNEDILIYDSGLSKWKNTAIWWIKTISWISGYSYSVGDIVSYRGKTYECTEVHTASSLFETDLYSGKWDDGASAGTILQLMSWNQVGIPYGYFDVTGTDAGQEVAIATYDSLYAVIGTAYNNCVNYTDGTTYANPSAGYFRLPDLRNSFLKNEGSNSTGTGHNASHSHTYGGSSTVSLGHTHSMYGGQVPVTNSPTSVGSISIPIKNSVIASPTEAYVAMGVKSNYSCVLSSSTNSGGGTFPALDSSGSGSSPEPNYYGVKILLKY